LTGGSAWVTALQREARARDVFVLVVTPDSLASQWCQEEIQLALASRRTILARASQAHQGGRLSADAAVD
jgi:short-subunit dehydrogenase